MAAKKNSGFEELRLQLKKGELKNLYLFFGEEEYIREEYVKKVTDLLPEDPFAEFNTVKIEGSVTDPDELDAILENFPMMAEKKTILIKDSGIFKTKDTASLKAPNEEMKSFWISKLENLADYVVLIFSEKEIDKRSAVYKAAAKHGVVAEFAYLSEMDMVNWATSEFLNQGKKIAKNNATYFVSLCDSDVASVKNEIDKLVSFCGEEILKSDIDRLVSKSLNVRIFEMTDGIMEKDTAAVMNVLTDLKNIKEPPFKILYTLFSTFDKMLHAYLAEKSGMMHKDIATKLKLHPFVTTKYINSAKGFGEEYLVGRVRAIAEIDLAIKQGEIADWDAIENFIAECIYYKK